MAAVVDRAKCTACQACVAACPVEATKMDTECAVVDSKACIDCGACVNECPNEAISLQA